jgi:hypothetical protein
MIGEIGMIYARLGNQTEALKQIEKLQSLQKPFDFGMTPYRIGRIHAYMGNKDLAIKYLNTALDEGAKFTAGDTFQHDPDLMILHDHPGYKLLIERNRLK